LRLAEPSLRALGLSLQTWTSAYLLAKLLHRLDDIHAAEGVSDGRLPILELGAGTGLVGMTAAMLWGVTVVLTDLGPIIPGLELNVALNSAVLQSTNNDEPALITCGSLDWNQPDKLILAADGGKEEASAVYSKANVILAADTVYSEEHPELLSKTILTWLAPGSASRAIIMYSMRVAYLEQIRELWALLEGGGLEAIQEGREQADERDASWDDELLCEWSIWKWKEE
jgi:hypothetical protein